VREREEVQPLQLCEILGVLTLLVSMFDQLLVGSGKGFLFIYSVFLYVLLFFVQLLAPTSRLRQVLLELGESLLLLGIGFLIDLLLKTSFQVVVV